MVEFTVDKLCAVKVFGASGWVRKPFEAVETLYNATFGTNYHSSCPVCARGRYIDALKVWYAMGLKWLAKRGLTLGNVYGIPYGLTTRTMNVHQRRQYDSLSRAEKIAYNKESRRGDGDEDIADV